VVLATVKAASTPEEFMEPVHFPERNLTRAVYWAGQMGDDSVEPGPTGCRKGEPCWPTAAEVEALSNSLDPGMKRSLRWNRGENPFPAPIPTGCGGQPLCGLDPLKPVYTKGLDSEVINSTMPFRDAFSKAATRDIPAEGWDPAFVVFPLTAAHVQTAVLFARKHNLCVSVAGTGHDFLNRHSCPNGVFIRTSLLKDMDWNLEQKGVVKLGSGLTFSEVSKAGADQRPSMYIATGWSSTVGIAGWSLGGGHGPLVPSSGLGVDNLVGAEVVLANGTLVTANAEENADLLWALRGGGGSTWGVVTAFFIRKHPTPAGGMTQMVASFAGDILIPGLLEKRIEHIIDWTLGLDEKWGGLFFMTSDATVWSIEAVWFYAGSRRDPGFREQKNKLLGGHLASIVIGCKDWFACNLPSEGRLVGPIESGIVPTKVPFANIVPSVIITRDVVGGAEFKSAVKSWFHACPLCGALEFYFDLPHPNTKKHFDPKATSIGSGFRDGMVHLIVPPDPISMKKFVHLGENSYFSESAYKGAGGGMSGDGWKKRYWGSNYERLLDVKTKYDPHNMFWCHHCVGSDRPRTFPPVFERGVSDVALLV